MESVARKSTSQFQKKLVADGRLTMSSPISRQQQQHSPRRSKRNASGNSARENRDGMRNTATPRQSNTHRHHALSVDTGSAAARRNISPYEPDSDSEMEDFRTRKEPKRASILKSGRDFLVRLGSSRDFDEEYESVDGKFLDASRDDESGASDECMILTDDEDDTSEIEEPSKRAKEDFTSLEDAASPRSSSSPSNLAAIHSIFAEKHPWRRQSRRDSPRPRQAHGPRLPSVNSMEDEFEEPSSTRSSLRERISGLNILQSRSEEEEEQEESSSSSEDDSTSTQSNVSVISDPEETLDFATLEKIPNFFTSHPEAMAAYLDPSASAIFEQDSSVFAHEHSLLLRAVLQLLAERDYIGVEADIDDPTCIMKKGPLKKATSSVGRTTWRVKYVEVRPGSFSYFEDSSKRENFGRKTIPLRSNRCRCESVKPNLFALHVEGGPCRLWMCNSEEECQAWVRAIRDSMVGAGAGESNHSFDVSQYQAALAGFQETKMSISRTSTRDEYLSCIEELLRTNIRIPARWVSDQVTTKGGTLSTTVFNTAAQKLSPKSLWRALKCEDSVAINGCLVSGSSPHATERVIGAISRCILELDRSSPIEAHIMMSEVQALSFARDVLMTVLQSREREQSRIAIEYLCRNSNLVEIESLSAPEAREPLSLQLSYASAEAIASPERDISGWLGTRTRSTGMWRDRFLVISDGILNVFEHSSPRPHGLRGQLLLSHATVSIVQEKSTRDSHLHILRIVGKNNESERQLAFLDETLLEEWKSVVEKAVDASSSPNGDEDPSSVITPRASIIPTAGGRIIQGASESGVKIIKGATDQFMKATDKIRASMRSGGKGLTTAGPHSRTSSTDMRLTGSRHSDSGDPTDSLGLTTSFESERIPKQEPTVQVTADSTTMYKIIAREPFGVATQETLAYVQLHA